MSCRRFPVLMLAAALLEGCIVNDIPYPVIVPVITSVDCPDAVAVDIDSRLNTVNIELGESARMDAVRIDDISFDNAITRCEPQLKGVLDLTSPVFFKLETYQEYEWKLTASQHIERYFTVKGQSGASAIDAANRRVIVNMPSTASLFNMQVLSCKLGPEGITSYDPDPSKLKDFTSPVSISVKAHGVSETWTVFVEQVDVTVTMKSLDAWSRVAWAAATGIEGKNNGFRYRKSGETEWTELDPSEIIEEGGDFRAEIDGLEPLTKYECLAFCGDESTEPVEFTTEAELQLPNSGFEIFSHAESKNYYSWFDESDPEAGSKWWDSGNAGSTMVGASASICVPDTYDKASGNASASLISKYVVIKFAAGNLFSGSFAGLVGTSGGIVDFGRPFSLRPRKLVLSLKYDCGIIDCIGSYPDDDPVKKGDPDRAQVFIALGDWDYRDYGGTPDSPVRVNTTRKETFFDPAGKNVIAYGTYITDSSTDGWTRVEIPLVYTSTSRRPSHIIISCAASMLGDYFTGSSKSVLHIDDLILEY